MDAVFGKAVGFASALYDALETNIAGAEENSEDDGTSQKNGKNGADWSDGPESKDIGTDDTLVDINTEILELSHSDIYAIPHPPKKKAATKGKETKLKEKAEKPKRKKSTDEQPKEKKLKKSKEGKKKKTKSPKKKKSSTGKTEETGPTATEEGKKKKKKSKAKAEAGNDAAQTTGRRKKKKKKKRASKKPKSPVSTSPKSSDNK